MIVTGASGLLGSEIVSQIPDCIGLSSKDCDLLSENSFRHILDKHIESGHKVEKVIHVAARVGGVKANTDYVANFFDDNIRINMNVMDGCFLHNIKLVSILSTCVYPDAPYVKYPLTEDQLHVGPPHHSNFGYAYAKRMLEVQSRAYRQQFGSNFISVIPNNLYGLNDNYDLQGGHVVPALIRKFYEAMLSGQDEVTVWGTGEPLREFTFARDAAKIILWLTENYDGESPVNIGNPEQTSIKNLALVIAEEIGFEGQIKFDNSKPDGQYEKPSSNKRLVSLGWNGEYTPLRKGLRETINFFNTRYPSVRGIRIET